MLVSLSLQAPDVFVVWPVLCGLLSLARHEPPVVSSGPAFRRSMSSARARRAAAAGWGALAALVVAAVDAVVRGPRQRLHRQRLLRRHQSWQQLPAWSLYPPLWQAMITHGSSAAALPAPKSAMVAQAQAAVLL